MNEGVAISTAFSWTFFSLLLGLVVAPLIYKDAKRLPKLFLGTPPWFWALCAPIAGPRWTLLVYWAIHHSSISNRLTPEAIDETDNNQRQ